MFQYQPLLSKIWTSKNLACPIEIDKVETTNNKSMRHVWAQTLFATWEYILFLKFYWSKIINMPERVKQQKLFKF